MNRSFRCCRHRVVPLCLLILAGCSVLENLTPARKPSAHVTRARLDSIDLQSATLQFDVAVENPASVALPLVNVDYRLASGAASFLSGSAALQGVVPAGSNRTVTLPARVVFADLLQLAKGIKPGSVVPYTLEAGLSVDPGIAGPIRLPATWSGELPVPVPPTLELKEIRWDRLTLGEASGHLDLGLVNPNAFPFDLRSIDYQLKLGGTQVAAASLAQAVSMGASGGTGSVRIPLSFSPTRLGLAVFRMLTGSQVNYDFSGNLAVSTPFGPMTLPVGKTGQTASHGP
ncbi:MAG: LEA type 2 family protein [Verrucomicrobiales bacterium]|nr:LEA type 2 family protein [Verrucomicrobiales bacterium]